MKLFCSLLKAYETGIRHRNTRKLYTPSPECVNGQFFQTIGLDEVSYPFIILIYGIGLSFLAAVFEVIQGKFKDKILKVLKGRGNLN